MSQEVFVYSLIGLAFLICFWQTFVIQNQREQLKKMEKSARFTIEHADKTDSCMRCGAPGVWLVLCEEHYDELIG